MPAEHLPEAGDEPPQLLQWLLGIASRLRPQPLATNKRGPKIGRAKAGYVNGALARAHVLTGRIIKLAGKTC